MLVSKQKHPVRKRRFVHKMKSRDADTVYIQYFDCFDKFFDEKGNKTTITITLPPTTFTPQVNTADSSRSNAFTTTSETSTTQVNNEQIWTIGGAAAGVMFLFMFVICCLVFSRRSEKKKRKKTEAEYRVLATTVTSITDTEDGTMYAQCIDQPTYGTELQLPSRKQRNRLGGVSNGIQTMKRWLSFEGDHASQPSNASNPHVGRQLPLPAIPEGGAKSNSFPRPALGKTLSVREGIYDEIGPDILRRSHVYNPLDMQRPMDMTGGVYDGLRTNTLPSRGGSRRSENVAMDNYFLLEPTIKETNRSTDQNTDNYFIVEKEPMCDINNRVVGNENETESVIRPTNDVIFHTNNHVVGNENETEPVIIASNDVILHTESACRKSSEVLVEEPDKLTNVPDEQLSLMDCSKNAEEENIIDKQTSKEDNNNESADGSNYFILEKEENDQNEDDYLEPMEKQRHSYIDVLPEQESFMKVKEKYNNKT